jgi:hypothetical protein
MLMSAVLVALSWVAVLRRRVHSQTELIRERLESEAALEKRYQRLFERNLVGVCRTSLDGRLLDCNEAMATFLVYNLLASMPPKPGSCGWGNRAMPRVRRTSISSRAKTRTTTSPTNDGSLKPASP